MKFEEYWKVFSPSLPHGKIIHDMSAASWDMCKKEFLRLLNERDSQDAEIHDLIECLKEDVEREL